MGGTAVSEWRRTGASLNGWIDTKGAAAVEGCAAISTSWWHGSGDFELRM